MCRCCSPATTKATSSPFDSRSVKNLWRYSTGTPVWGAAPMTYLLDGKQHIVIASGTTLLSFALPDR